MPWATLPSQSPCGALLRAPRVGSHGSHGAIGTKLFVQAKPEASHAAPHAVLVCQLWILGDPKPRRHLGTAVPAGCRYVQSNLTCTFSCEIQGHFWPSCSRQGSYRSFMSPTPKQEHCLKSKIMKPGMELDHKEEQPKPSMWALLPYGIIFSFLLLQGEAQQPALRPSEPEQPLSASVRPESPPAPRRLAVTSAFTASLTNRRQIHTSSRETASCPPQFSCTHLFYCSALVSFYMHVTGWLILILDDRMSSKFRLLHHSPP